MREQYNNFCEQHEELQIKRQNEKRSSDAQNVHIAEVLKQAKIDLQESANENILLNFRI